MSIEMMHSLQANNVELHTINKPIDLLRHLTGLVEHRNNALNDMQHRLQQADTEIFNQQGELHKRGQEIGQLKDARAALETDLRNFRQYHDTTVKGIESKHREEIMVLTRRHDEYVTALRRNHSEQQAQLQSSYQNQIDVMKANHETFVLSEQQKHSEELEELNTWTKKTVEKAEEAMRRGVDNFQAKPDRTFVLLFDELKAAVQNLIAFNIDPSALRFDQPFKARASELRLQPSNNVLLLQSFLWGMVIDLIFKSPFSVFGTYGERLAETWSLLFSHGKSRGYISICFEYQLTLCLGGSLSDNRASRLVPDPESSAEKWRYTTIERLQTALKNKQSTQESDRQIRQSYQENVLNLEQSISTWLAQMGAFIEMEKIQDIVKTACEFALIIAVERCRVQLYAPSPGEDMKSGAEGILDATPGYAAVDQRRTVQFIVEPGLVKNGNARGGALQSRVFLSRAVVYFGS